jgi:solute carrier family 35 (UDP-galactose transporter), member B1
MGAATSPLKLLTLVSGTYFFYLFYGVFQEAIWTKEENGEQFNSTLLLLFIQCVINALGAVVFLFFMDMFGSAEVVAATDDSEAVVVKDQSEPAESAPSYIRALFGKRLTGNLWMGCIALFYVFAMGASNQALQHVNYPTQALGKSCKMIPIMAANVLINGTEYSSLKYLSAFCITVGIVMFRVFKASTKAVGANSNVGLMLLVASLCLDGLTASNQKQYRNEFSSPTVRGSLRMMRQTNVWACLYVGGLALITGDLFTGTSYIAEHPHLIKAIFQFSLCSACGQCFIFLTITGPGPLVCTTITTTRKFFTILISVFLNPKNTLTQTQWGAVGLVFLGLGAELYEKYETRQKKE